MLWASSIGFGKRGWTLKGYRTRPIDLINFASWDHIIEIRSEYEAHHPTIIRNSEPEPLNFPVLGSTLRNIHIRLPQSYHDIVRGLLFCHSHTPRPFRIPALLLHRPFLFFLLLSHAVTNLQHVFLSSVSRIGGWGGNGDSIIFGRRQKDNWPLRDHISSNALDRRFNVDMIGRLPLSLGDDWGNG